MNVNDQFLGQTYLGSIFPSGTKAEEEGSREWLQSLSLLARLSSSLDRASQRRDWQRTSSGCGLSQLWPRLRLGSLDGRCLMC